MEKTTIKFAVCKQALIGGDPLVMASGTVNYVDAEFDLSTDWQGFDAVRAVWSNGRTNISTTLADGACVVPHEVLAKRGHVYVNLVGSNVIDEELVDRLTTEPVLAAQVAVKSLLTGENTKEVTPSEYEQFVAETKNNADTASAAADASEASAVRAETAATNAQASAEYAEEVAGTAIKVKNMTVSSETLPAGSEATVTKTESTEAFNLHFGIPTGSQGPQGPAGATGPAGTNGADGRRGYSILQVRANPPSRTGTIDGVNYSYRQSLSTIKNQAEVEEVYAKDIVKYNARLYPVVYVDTSYAYYSNYIDLTGPAGADYVLTNQDKSDIADIVVQYIGSADTMSF